LISSKWRSLTLGTMLLLFNRPPKLLRSTGKLPDALPPRSFPLRRLFPLPLPVFGTLKRPPPVERPVPLPPVAAPLPGNTAVRGADTAGAGIAPDAAGAAGAPPAAGAAAAGAAAAGAAGAAAGGLAAAAGGAAGAAAGAAGAPAGAPPGGAAGAAAADAPGAAGAAAPAFIFDIAELPRVPASLSNRFWATAIGLLLSIETS